MNIFKYPLGSAGLVTVAMPKGARVLSAQEQRGQLCLWAMVDPDQKCEARLFAIHGTGNGLPDDPGEFIAAVQQGSLVWHIFEITRR